MFWFNPVSPCRSNFPSLAGMQVPGMCKYFITTYCSWGWWFHFCFQYRIKSSFSPIFLCCMHCHISMTALEVDVHFNVISATCWSSTCHQPCSVFLLSLSLSLSLPAKLGSSPVDSLVLAVQLHLCQQMQGGRSCQQRTCFYVIYEREREKLSPWKNPEPSWESNLRPPDR